MANSFWIDFRRFFLRGLATVLPALLTIILIVYVFNFVNDKFGNAINDWIIAAIATARGTDVDKLHQWWYERWYLRAVGFVVTVIGLYFIGRFVASFIGRGLWRLLERAMLRTPVFKQIYPNIKQVTDLLLSDQTVREFSRVVAVEYPRKGIWSLGLVTGKGVRSVCEKTGSEMLTVFVPSSPTPVTGYTIIVRRDEVIDAEITIDEALRFTVSGGVLVPAAERIGRTVKGLPEGPSLPPLIPVAAAAAMVRPDGETDVTGQEEQGQET